jgi:AraC family transcriptional regulator
MQRPLPETFHGKPLDKRVNSGLALMERRYPGGLATARHAHELPCFAVVLDGTYTESCDRRTVACVPDLVLFRPAGELHRDQFHDRGARLLIVELRDPWVRRLDDHRAALERFVALRGGPLLALGGRVRREFHRQDRPSWLAIEGLMLEMVAELGRIPDESSFHQLPRWLTDARDILHDRLGENLRHAELAGLVGIHPVHLARRFRQAFRCTMGEYVRRLRIEHACDQMRQSRVPLSRIAAMAGFADQSHFSRTFKRVTGVTPLEFRRTGRHRR